MSRVMNTIWLKCSYITRKTQLFHFIEFSRFFSQPTEGRQCIQDVFRAYKLAENSFHIRKDQLNQCLENTVQIANIGHSSHFTVFPPSCGNTVQCFISLFLSHEQINQNFLYNTVSGGIFQQFWNNQNLSVYELSKSQRFSPAFYKFALPGFRSYCQNRAVESILSFDVALASNDSDSQLPRIFMCNLSWITNQSYLPSVTVTTADCSNSNSRDMTNSGQSQDHEIVVIKRLSESNPLQLEYQIIQGYLRHSSGDTRSDGVCGPLEKAISSTVCDVSELTSCSINVDMSSSSLLVMQTDKSEHTQLDGVVVDSNLSCVDIDTASPLTSLIGEDITFLPLVNTSDGYDLHEWQNSGNKFSNRLGFSSAEMSSFLNHLRVFATSETWDSENHMSAFNQTESSFDGHAYMPAFSFRELRDDHIIGWGERPLMDAVTLLVNERTVETKAT